MDMLHNSNSTLMAMLERSLADGGDGTALIDNGKMYSYNQLNTFTLHICHLLASSSPRRGPVILVMKNRLHAVICGLAVIRSGRCFVPLDNTLPHESLIKIAEHLHEPVLLTDSDLEDVMGTLPVVKYVKLTEKENEKSVPIQTEVIGEDSIAYIMSTSGSTGVPKLVQVSHRAICHYILWQRNEIGVDSVDRYGHLAPVSFDFSFKEWLAPLVSGGSVVIGPVEIKFNPKLLAQWISQNRVTVLCCIPFIFRQLVEGISRESQTEQLKFCLTTLRLIMISGEVLPSNLVRRWQENMGKTPMLMNLYGPTESTVIKLFYRIPFPYVGTTMSVPLGKPIVGSSVEIVNETQVMPGGETGQVSLVSNSLSVGYYCDPVRTAAKFVKTGREKLPDEKTLLTGDYGYLDENSDVVYLGRMDYQVKRMGIRIDLDEITATLLSIEGIRDAVVTSSCDPITINAYVVLNDGISPSDAKQRTALKLKSSHMPDTFHFMDRLPKLNTGKTNVNLLKSQTILQLSAIEKKGTPLLETQLLDIWKMVLRREDIFPDSDFFEYGGDSSKLMEVLGRVRENNIPHLNAIDIFGNPTIKALCHLVESRSAIKHNLAT